jgi:hypothetical protein
LTGHVLASENSEITIKYRIEPSWQNSRREIHAE